MSTTYVSEIRHGDKKDIRFAPGHELNCATRCGLVHCVFNRPEEWGIMILEVHVHGQRRMGYRLLCEILSPVTSQNSVFELLGWRRAVELHGAEVVPQVEIQATTFHKVDICGIQVL